MKLWQKIFLYTLTLVMLAVSATSILLLKNSFSLAIEQKKQAAYTEHEFLITNFKNMLLSERLAKNAILLEQEEVIGYMENTFGGVTVNHGIAFFDKKKEQVYCNFSLENVKGLIEKVDKTGENFMQVLDNKLYIASKETIENNTYYFMTETDINEVWLMHQRMLEDVSMISMVCAVIIAVILLLVVKLLLIPLQKINEGTRAIAQGEYHRRVPQKGKDEISQLAQNMNQMAAAVEKNVKALEDVAENRKQFIANLSHEMKTPLTSILGFSDLLRIKKDISDEERVEYATIIKEEASRMRILSGKLMEMITVGEANLEWVYEDMGELFGEIGISLGIVAKSHGIMLEYGCEKGFLWMDRELIKSLVYNLIDNAIKASGEGDTIWVKGWFEQEVFLFSITDQGIGIPKEEIASIMQAFYMVDKVRSRASGGAGLGLALCAEIAALHRGEITIESQLEEGTTVTVRMKGGKKLEIC